MYCVEITTAAPRNRFLERSLSPSLRECEAMVWSQQVNHSEKALQTMKTCDLQKQWVVGLFCDYYGPFFPTGEIVAIWQNLPYIPLGIQCKLPISFALLMRRKKPTSWWNLQWTCRSFAWLALDFKAETCNRSSQIWTVWSKIMLSHVLPIINHLGEGTSVILVPGHRQGQVRRRW